MNALVYFTSEAWIDDGELRRQVIRIPEVMARIRKLEKSQGDKDWLSVFIIDEEFQKLSRSEKIYLSNLAQQALFERAQSKLQIQVEEVIRRSQFENIQQTLDVFVQKQFDIDETRKQVLVVGPAADEVMFLLRGNKKFEFIDLVDQDPCLSWFWPKLEKAQFQ